MAAQEDKLVIFFKDIDKHDLPLVGGKGANLGEMTKAHFPVPNGFAVTVKSYDVFLQENNLTERINNILVNLDENDVDQLNSASRTIGRIIKSAKIPDTVAKEVHSAYIELSNQSNKSAILVAVRSSATAEDLPSASFAGQQASYMNIEGSNNLLNSIQDCWASLFTARAIFYRNQNKIKHEQVKISVIVQKMVQSDVSGVMFSMDPVTNDKDTIVIEAVWGLGDMIVQGQVVPDRYLVQKETFSILSKKVSDQTKMLTRVSGETKENEVPEKQIDLRKLSDEEILVLAKLAQRLQDHYYFPQDIEWAKEGTDLFITQTRPITTIESTDRSKKSALAIGKKNDEGQDSSANVLLQGTSASPGIASGHVKIVKSPNEINKVNQGDVLVAEMTSPDYVPAMKKASAIVTDKGGLTSHAAIVSRELGVPAVVGTDSATTSLTTGQVVTVDGGEGLVYEGGNLPAVKVLGDVQKKSKIAYHKTKTNVYVNLAEPELAEKTAKLKADGIGLLRAEFMIANIGVHPKLALEIKTQDDFVKNLASNLEKFAKAFYPRQVVYRATDFKTNEYRSLKGGAKYEPEEPNPMLGFRGAYRYIADPEVFNLELQAIKLVRQKYTNLQLMIPFARSPEELKQVRRMVQVEGLFEDPTFKFWMMVEIPINVILLEDFIAVGIDGVSIGSNDLTMLVTGTDRDNSEVARAFNERSKAVYWALKRTIKICNKHGITSSICGQAPSVYEDMVKRLVKYGVTSVSVSPDAVDRVRNVIYEAEQDLLIRK